VRRNLARASNTPPEKHLSHRNKSEDAFILCAIPIKRTNVQLSFIKNLRGDIFGGITAAVVALPLALAFGVASGLGPIAGLYGAIAVGFFASVFGGTPAQVSGPTGPMTVVMAGIVMQFADRPETAFAIVFLGGAMQILFGILRLGRYISYTPYSVMSGFMSGIGAIIILIQIVPLLGHRAASGGPVGTLDVLPQALASVNVDALLLGLVALAIMIFWPTRLRTVLPPPLAALVIGTALSVTLLTGAPVIGQVPTGLPPLHLPRFGLGDLAVVLQPALVLALLGTIDSLLTSLVADSITRTHHNSNRELVGQGIGNMAAGLLGALPGAGATMRTVVNVRAGGRTQVSGALHALILMSLVLGLAPLASHIPHAVLAGILIKVGWDIVDWGYLRRLRSAPGEKVVVMFVTFGLTVFVDLITAVAVGLILAGFVTARWMEREEMKGVTALELKDEPSLDEADRAAMSQIGEQVAIVFLRGRFSYASARELGKNVGASISGHRVVILDFSEVVQKDTSAAMAVGDLIHMMHDAGSVPIVAGLSGSAEKTLRGLGVLDRVSADNILGTTQDAIHRAAEILNNTT